MPNIHIAKVTRALPPLITFLTNRESSLDQRINNLEKMLKAELKSAADTKKQEAKDKLEDNLKGLKFYKVKIRPRNASYNQ